MAQLWSVLVPEAGQNYVVNPSAETTGNYSVTGGTTATRVNTFAWAGFYSYEVAFAAGGTFVMTLDSTLPPGTYCLALSVKGSSLTNIQAQLEATWTNLSTFTVDDGAISDPNGARIYKVFTVAASMATLEFRISSGSATLYIDAVHIDLKSYLTTYVDGDMAGCYWNGARHGSGSNRSAVSRAGGRLRNFDDYSLVVLLDSNRFGMAPIQNNIQSRALQPGADFLSSRVLPREVNLILSVNGSSLSNLHTLRQQAIDIFGPDRSGGNQPVVLAYSGANSTRRAYAKFNYGSGLEFNGVQGFLETIPLRLLAVDPFWYEAGNVTAALGFTQNVNSTYLSRRSVTGLYADIGGLNGNVKAFAYDPVRNRTYIGGEFTTGASGGTTLNRVGYIDGISGTVQAMGTGGGIGVDDTVYALAIAPNGDVIVGGTFNNAGGVASTKLARWVLATNTWVQYTLTGGGGTVVYIYALAFDKDGLLYVAGVLSNVGGANGDGIFAYDFTNITALGTGLSTPAEALNVIVTSDGSVIASGPFTVAGGVSCGGAAKWNGSAWVSLGSITANVNQKTLFEAPDKTVYIAGTTALYKYTGNTLIQIYDIGQTILRLSPYLNNSVLISLSGASSYFGGATYQMLWNGTTFTLPDFLTTTTPGSSIFNSVVIPNNSQPPTDTVAILGHTTVTLATSATTSSVTTVSTADTYPAILITGPTSAGATCRLKWIENLTTGERVFFNLPLTTGDSTIIDFRPGARGVYSGWGGRAGANSVTMRSVGINGGGLNPGVWRSVSDQPLGASDFASFNLASGANTLLVFISGTTTGVTCALAYTPVHMGADGVA